jgi:hypothetical protein
VLRHAHFADNLAIVEFSLHYTVQGKAVSREGISLFEFSGDKISRIAEY